VGEWYRRAETKQRSNNVESAAGYTEVEVVGLTAGRSRVVAVVPRYAARHTTKLAEPRKDESVSARGLNKLHNYNNGAAGGGGWRASEQAVECGEELDVCVCVWCCACCVRRRARERMTEPFSALRSIPLSA